MYSSEGSKTAPWHGRWRSNCRTMDFFFRSQTSMKPTAEEEEEEAVKERSDS